MAGTLPERRARVLAPACVLLFARLSFEGMGQRWRAGAIAFIVAGVGVSNAGAADARSEAQRRFDEGKQLYRGAHDVEGARAKFAQAYALQPRPEILWNLAICELDLDLGEDALRHLRAYARSPEAREALVERVPELVSRARRSLGALRVFAPRGAVVRVDDRIVDPRDWRDEAIDLSPGDRVLVVDLHGERHEDIVTIRRGELVERRFEASPSAAVDQGPAAAAPPTSGPELPSPPASLAALPIAPPAESPTERAAPPPPPMAVAQGATFDAAPLVLAGLSLAALGAGVAFSLASQADADDAARARAAAAGLDCRSDGAAPCATLRSATDTGRTHAWLAVGSYASSAVLAGAGAWFALGGRTISAFFAPGGAGLRGSF